ncbi:hypothetical protein BDA96_04G314600 [Sorghum bicolor]|uniref:PHD-type zinc finger plants domain-containing protein n=1 Tax=Sorghum bicolor TaxID=4558 RepID=A0A921R7I3_SORBI|nr:hypothetical protein BDA96_04G314600 [Sorghum bicolor]
MAGTTVCSMCGDVGFPDKLFRCARCRRRFQHSYCTNYYGDAAPAEAGAGVCDWCLSVSGDVVGGKKRQYSSVSGHGKQQQQRLQVEEEEAGRSMQQPASSFASSGCSKGAGKVTGGSEHAEGGRRPRRYKLLKDVMC